MGRCDLEIRLLGRLEVLSAGQSLPLPPSKKTRALFAYLVATEHSYSRQHLCDLLWEEPIDPRAALRWSLTKLRPLLNDDQVTRLVTRGDRVGFESHEVQIDLTTIRALVHPSPTDVATHHLQQAVSLFRGAFLEELDLPDCYRYDTWYTTERQAVHRLQDMILATLVERLQDTPEIALSYARDRLLIDPFSEAAYLDLIRILGKIRRIPEAIEQYENCRQMLAREFGAQPSLELEAVRQSLMRTSLAPCSTLPESAQAISYRPLIGRRTECQTLKQFAQAAETKHATDMLLITGEPGVGKTRLLQELESEIRARGGYGLTGSAFDIEMVRPYGAWIDALRTIAPEYIPPNIRAKLAPLLPQLGATSVELSDRNQLFEAVVSLLQALAAKVSLVAVVLDDLHWFDEASAALLHFVARQIGSSRVLLAGAARQADLEDNPAVRRLIRALRHDRRLYQLDLTPLDANDTALLVQSIDPQLDVDCIFAESQGNPLFALEIAHALQHSNRMQSNTLNTLISDRLSTLTPPTQTVIPWAAALGHRFRIETLSVVTELPTTEILTAIAELERRSILITATSEEYDFAHDLVRRVAYSQMAEPRRRLIHRQIARTFAQKGAIDEALAGEIAHHAALGGDLELAARACLMAGRHSLQIFAYHEVATLATRGLMHTTDLPQEARLSLQLDLLELYVHPGMRQFRPANLEERLRQVIGQARSLGLHALVQIGFYLIANLYYQRGDVHGALDGTRSAEAAGRAADPVTVVRAIADTARCLGLLERDMERAKILAQEAQTLANDMDLTEELYEISMAMGLVQHYNGELNEALEEFEQALRIAQRDGDHWWECYCLMRLIMIELERAHPSQALQWCQVLNPIAQQMGNGSEAPFAAALEAIAQRALQHPQAMQQVDQALERLRQVDSQWMLAYVQIWAAEMDLQAGQFNTAHRRAEAALTAATIAGRQSEGALAHTLLANLAIQKGSPDIAAHHLDVLQKDLASGKLSVRAQKAVWNVTQALSR
jgi:DNA-binding SARP family transcriptional activator/DNA polymerase III delta prime subunit